MASRRDSGWLEKTLPAAVRTSITDLFFIFQRKQFYEADAYMRAVGPFGGRDHSHT